MELEQWLIVYQTVTGAHATRERSLWLVYASMLVTQATLFLAFLLAMPEMIGAIRDDVRLGISCLGLLLSVIWLLLTLRNSAECRHVERLLRSMEGQFAGGEFQRSLHRLSRGEKVCVSASQFTCDEWLPSVARYRFAIRIPTSVLASVTAVALGAAWISVLVSLLAA